MTYLRKGEEDRRKASIQETKFYHYCKVVSIFKWKWAVFLHHEFLSLLEGAQVARVQTQDTAQVVQSLVLDEDFYENIFGVLQRNI